MAMTNDRCIGGVHDQRRKARADTVRGAAQASMGAASRITNIHKDKWRRNEIHTHMADF